MRTMSTRPTRECRLALAVGLLAVAAFGTGSAGVSRIDVGDRDTSQPSLVIHERPKLPERPTAEPMSRVSAPCRDPIADMRQFFQRDPATAAFGGLHKRFGQTVVYVPSEPGFLLVVTPQLTADRPRAFALPGPSGGRPLQFPTMIAVSGTNVFNLIARCPVAVRIERDVGHAEVHTDEVGRRQWCPVGCLHCDR